MPFNHLILCFPFLLLPSIFLSIKVFSNVSALRIRWPKCWSCSFSINLYNEYSELIFFRTDWLDLLSVKGTLRSLLQHHRSKASILRCSAFFTVQLSHPYTTTGKTIALRDQIANIHWIIKKAREFQKNISVCFIDYAKATINCGKFWKRWEYQTTWSASWEICMQVRKQQLDLNMEKQTGSK